MSDKPREFLIDANKNATLPWRAYPVDMASDELFIIFTHVIEYSAYSAMAAENERLRAALVKINESPCEIQSFEKRWCCQFRHWAEMALKREGKGSGE